MNMNPHTLKALPGTAMAVLALVLSMIYAVPVSAHKSPDGCTGSGLEINLFTDVQQVLIGSPISFSVNVFNGLSSGPIVCDATGITASIVTPDGASHPVTLVRTALSSGQSDQYTNAVTYTARTQDVKPNGSLADTASTIGTIHQNDTDSTGGGNQGVNITIKTPPPPPPTTSVPVAPVITPPPTVTPPPPPPTGTFTGGGGGGGGGSNITPPPTGVITSTGQSSASPTITPPPTGTTPTVTPPPTTDTIVPPPVIVETFVPNFPNTGIGPSGPSSPGSASTGGSSFPWSVIVPIAAFLIIMASYPAWKKRGL